MYNNSEQIDTGKLDLMPLSDDWLPSSILHGGEQRRWPITRRVVAGLAVVLTAAGCLPKELPYTSSTGAPIDGQLYVGVLGDSQADQAEKIDPNDPTGKYNIGSSNTFLDSSIKNDGFNVSSATFPGSVTKDLINTNTSMGFNGWTEHTPNIAVVVEGVNDRKNDLNTGQPTVSLEESKSNYDTYLRRTGASCNVLVAIPETTPWGLDVNGPAWNQFLQSEAATYNGVYVNWNDTVAQHPEYVDSKSQVHQTRVGRAEFILTIAAGVNQCRAIINSA